MTYEKTKAALAQFAEKGDQNIVSFLVKDNPSVDYSRLHVMPDDKILGKALKGFYVEDAVAVAKTTESPVILASLAAKDKRKTVLLAVAENPHLPEEEANKLFRAWSARSDQDYIETLLKARGRKWAEERLLELDYSNRSLPLHFLVSQLAKCGTEATYRKACELYLNEKSYWLRDIFTNAVFSGTGVPFDLLIEDVKEHSTQVWSRYSREDYRESKAWELMAEASWKIGGETLEKAWGTQHQILYKNLLNYWVNHTVECGASFEEVCKHFYTPERIGYFIEALKRVQGRSANNPDLAKLTLEHIRTLGKDLSIFAQIDFSSLAMDDQAALGVIRSGFERSLSRAFNSIKDVKVLKEACEVVCEKAEKGESASEMPVLSFEEIQSLESLGLKRSYVEMLVLSASINVKETRAPEAYMKVFVNATKCPLGRWLRSANEEELNHILNRLENENLDLSWEQQLLDLFERGNLNPAMRVRLLTNVSRSSLRVILEKAESLNKGELTQAALQSPSACERISGVFEEMLARRRVGLDLLEEAAECLTLRWDSSEELTAKTVFKFFKENFQEDLALWETGITLLGGWNGTLRDLINAVKNL